MPVHDETATETETEEEIEERLDIACFSVPTLGDGRCRGVVLEHDRPADSLTQGFGHRDGSPHFERSG